MLRTILFFSLVLANSYMAIGQYNVGAKLGFNVYKSRFNFPEDEQIYNQKLKMGFQVGSAIDVPLKSIIHFYGEAYYSMKGKKTDLEFDGTRNVSTFHFLESFLALRLNFKGGKTIAGEYKWHMDIGPTVGYWLGGRGKALGDGYTAKYKIEFSDDLTNASIDNMVISSASRWQWGLLTGVGIDYPVVANKQIMYLDLRVGFGGSNLTEYNGQSLLAIPNFSDSTLVRFLEFHLSVAYTFSVDWRLLNKGNSTSKKRRMR